MMSGNIESIFRNAALILAVAYTAGSCSFPEKPCPEEPGTIVRAEISLDITLPGTAEDIVPDGAYTRRFIVEAAETNGASATRAEYIEEDITATKYSRKITMTLRPGEYTLTVWSDYSAGTGDLLYDTSSLRTVTFAGPYTACDNAKDAFAGSTTLDLRPYKGQAAEIETTLNLSRAVGRFEIVTTDADLFRKHLGEGKIEGSSFTLRMTCDGLLACGYNCVDALRKELFSGKSYTVALPAAEEIGGPEMLLCFDYCLCAPGEKLDIPMTAALLDGQGRVVALSRISVPLSTGMNTRVYGRFLTAYTEGGIIIDPSFDNTVHIDLGTLTPR